ncbi:MAG: UDP-N-acetylmuramate dehydrogenase, partial [Pseudomonadota bacterium]
LTETDLPQVRGRYIFGADLSAVTWFRAGGPADVLYSPADKDDLSNFLANLDAAIPVFVMGVGSNLLVRDGGVRGVVIRLGRAFGDIETSASTVIAGAAALDAQVAKRAASAGVAGLEFLRGVPGSIGGALRMNAGAYGSEVKDIFVSAEAVDRAGKFRELHADDMGFAYRHTAAPSDLIFLKATFQGRPGEAAEIEGRMADIMEARESSQPIKERTGGSTFANPDPVLSGGRKSWQLIDAIGGRGRVVGDAQVSEQHCNFLINRGQAQAADIEMLGESLREDVRRETGVELRWEIMRIGEAAP